jgi:hypothetical protein
VITILGALVATAAFPTTTVGYRELLAWARSFGLLHRAGVEGTRSYGAALARYLRWHAVTVVEVNRPDRAARRRQRYIAREIYQLIHDINTAQTPRTA